MSMPLHIRPASPDGIRAGGRNVDKCKEAAADLCCGAAPEAEP